jgi:hypothetical protein
VFIPPDIPKAIAYSGRGAWKWVRIADFVEKLERELGDRSRNNDDRKYFGTSELNE